MKTLLAILSTFIFLTLLVAIADGASTHIKGNYKTGGMSGGVYNELEKYITIKSPIGNMEEHKKTIISLSYTIWCRQTKHNEDPWLVGLEIWADYANKNNPIELRNNIVAHDTSGCWNNTTAVYDYPNDLTVANSMLIGATIYGITLDTVEETTLLLTRLKSL